LAARDARGRASPGAVVAVVVGLGVLLAVYLLPAGAWTQRLVESIRGAGATGVALFTAAYVAATLLLVPGSLLTAGAGFAYGPLLGTLLVSPVSVAAATLAFVLGRTAARGWIARRIAGNARFAAVDEAIGRSGFKVVLLLRLSPLFPFSVLNYALGLTRLSLRDYVVASALGMMPGTFLYVYLGSLVTSASELGSGGAPGGLRTALYWGGLAATLGVSWVLARIAQNALSRAIDTGPPAQEWTSCSPRR
jgi:uncharacterized membrane protein YdjX (TVP38/TMEM64 family)